MCAAFCILFETESDTAYNNNIPAPVDSLTPCDRVPAHEGVNVPPVGLATISSSRSAVPNSLRPHGPPGSSVHESVRARILEWVASSFSRGIFPT